MRKYVQHFNPDLLGAQAGIFFAIINMYFACGGDLQSKEKPFDYFVLIFGLVTLLNTSVLPIFKTKITNASEEESRLLNNDSFSIAQSPELFRVEKIIFALSSMGTVNAAFNIARFNPKFVNLVFNSMASQAAYATFIFSISALPLVLNTAFPSVFQKSLMEACGKSGVWIGAIFAFFLTQFVTFSQASIPPLEVNVMADVMGALFLTDIAMSLKFNLSPAERGGYFFIFLETLRTAVSCFGNVMALPNILSLSHTFNAATDSLTKQIIYGAAGATSLLWGGAKACRLTRTLCQALHEPDTLEFAIQQA